MARSQYQVLVIPYFLNHGEPVYGVFRRRDMGLWQFISGGGEDTDESIEATARREVMEETGLSGGFLSTGHLLQHPGQIFPGCRKALGPGLLRGSGICLRPPGGTEKYHAVRGTHGIPLGGLRDRPEPAAIRQQPDRPLGIGPAAETGYGMTNGYLNIGKLRPEFRGGVRFFQNRFPIQFREGDGLFRMVGIWGNLSACGRSGGVLY